MMIREDIEFKANWGRYSEFEVPGSRYTVLIELYFGHTSASAALDFALTGYRLSPAGVLAMLDLGKIHGAKKSSRRNLELNSGCSYRALEFRSKKKATACYEDLKKLILDPANYVRIGADNDSL